MMIGMIWRWIRLMLSSGDIVITPFIYSDLKGLKVRPALVLFLYVVHIIFLTVIEAIK